MVEAGGAGFLYGPCLFRFMCHQAVWEEGEGDSVHQAKIFGSADNTHDTFAKFLENFVVGNN